MLCRVLCYAHFVLIYNIYIYTHVYISESFSNDECYCSRALVLFLYNIQFLPIGPYTISTETTVFRSKWQFDLKSIQWSFSVFSNRVDHHTIGLDLIRLVALINFRILDFPNQLRNSNKISICIFTYASISNPLCDTTEDWVLFVLPEQS